jgi:hypothetical protein
MDGIKERHNHVGQDYGHGSLQRLAGPGIMPGDASGGIFTRRPVDKAAEEEKPEHVEDAAAMNVDAAVIMDDVPDTAEGALENGRSHRKKREGKRHRDREGNGRSLHFIVKSVLRTLS